MCAIAGLIDRSDSAALGRMTEIQRHRGPDDSGTWGWRSPAGGSRVFLGSRRLSIQDLSPAGHMPMTSRDGKLCIVYNGEVYNAPALRRELEASGEKFVSRSDTEVVLALYRRVGAAALKRLNGIFAFAICDLRSGRPEILLARDPFGVKPLYYEEAAGGLAFASEMKALLELDDVERAVEPAALRRFLAFLWVPEPETMFPSIKKLPAGHYATLCDGRLIIRRYWMPTFPPAGYRFGGDRRNMADEARQRFFAAVKAQMLSDVPVGAFLSAGLDSSSIVAAMAQAANGPVRTYTITFPPEHLVGEANLDDAAVAARTARHFGAIHTEIVVRPNVAELLPKLLWHMDEPVADPAIVTAYSVCERARQAVTVLLSGVGGDEVFGGYRKYLAALAARSYQRLPAWLRAKVIEPKLAALPPMSGSRFKGYARWARKWAARASLSGDDGFIADSIYLDASQRQALAPGFADLDVAQTHHQTFSAAKHADFLNQMLYCDMRVFMPSLNLNYNDKMAMASSLEVRLPFLDHEFVDWVAWNVPPQLKASGLSTKILLRQAMQGIVPEEVLRQPKASFGAPVGYWLENDLREMTDDILSVSGLKRRGWLNAAVVRRMIDEHRSGAKDWGIQIWQFLTLELWAQRFVDQSCARTAA